MALCYLKHSNLPAHGGLSYTADRAVLMMKKALWLYDESIA
jgi:hypothetical protein